MCLSNVNWSLVTAVIAVLFSIVSYWLTRRKERAWKRTEFLFSQSQYLDNDPTLIEAVTILEDRHPSIKIADIYDSGGRLDKATREEYVQKFDKLLNFLWRLCYAYLAVKTFSKKEIAGFSWYFWRISEYPVLAEYCKQNGYEEINDVIERMQPDWKD
jgi:hypothetical protein